MTQISRNQIHLWFVTDPSQTEANLLQEYEKLLTVEEMERYKRFHFLKHRQQFLVTRALQRTVLSYYIPEVAPSEWRFDKNDHGKPFIALPHISTEIYFNLSHTDHFIMMAVSTHPLLGVDVETLDRKSHPVQLASELFTPVEIAQLNNLSIEDQPKRFFEIWTLKEAYIKALGVGITRPMGNLEYSVSEQGPHILLHENKIPECTWQFWHFLLMHHYQCALALCAPFIETTNIHFFQFHTPDIYHVYKSECRSIPTKG